MATYLDRMDGGKHSSEETEAKFVPKAYIITLRRNDLIKWKSNISIEDITIHDFKRDVMSMDQKYKADLVIFIDEDGTKRELKSRFL